MSAVKWNIKANEHQQQVKREVRETVIKKVRIAMEIQQGIARCWSLNPQVRITQNGLVTIQLSGHGMKTGKLRKCIHDLCRRLQISFAKSLSSSNFLRYVGVFQGVRIFIHTRECFYGGEPRIIKRKRTTAICTNLKGHNQNAPLTES